ncbi:basement membrane-specific heparan sulfate proteoglycan core protein-like [Penaeus japonicus]|uniref:basement membrane-specific heparan sulfate proteoglycan core protein-like n=1 Tax=Penaeus japonicus TaxID=27405 RepID=UPI001C7106E1|nr:basement membrane-specific heparan sulfate proteoglycan core protein-like [Penaeus japonicus]
MQTNLLSNASLPSAGQSIAEVVTVSRQDDGAKYECRVNTSLFSRPLASAVTFNVQSLALTLNLKKVTSMTDPPSNADCDSGPEVVGSGNTVTFTCVTSPANPPAAVTWTIHAYVHLPVSFCISPSFLSFFSFFFPSFFSGSLTKKSKSTVSRGIEGHWVTTSTLTYRVPRSSNELSIRCLARNEASSTPVVSNKSVQVIKTPKPPVVEADMKGTVVAGTVLDLTCTTHGGHPPRQVKMYKGEEEMEIEIEEDENVTIAHTAITVEPADNKVKVLCEVLNPASQEPLTGHTTINLFFPAWEVKGWVNPRSVEVKEEVTLGCETAPSIPPSTVTWHSGGATLEGAITRQYPGKYGGTVTSSELRVRPLADDNGRVFSCNANNGLGVTVSADLTIDVLHGPRWVEVPSPVLDVQEGRDLILSAVAMANPPPVRYNWHRGEFDLLSTGISGGELRLHNVSRNHSANYTVTATSARGTESYGFFINVLFGPENVTAPERVTVNKGHQATLTCFATGNPTPNVTWTRRSDNTSVLWWGAGEARLVVPRAARSDTGVYCCHASSSVGKATPIATALVVSQAPWWPAWKNRSAGVGVGVWARAGQKARIECRAWAVPKPTVQWQRQSDPPLYSNYKYHIQEPELMDGLVEWSAALEVRNVAPQDFGNYSCTFRNPLGSFASTHALSPPPKPAVPRNFTIINVTTSSATMTWAENTDGGQPIGYTLKYWKQDTPHFQELKHYMCDVSSKEIHSSSEGNTHVFETLLPFEKE